MCPPFRCHFCGRLITDAQKTFIAWNDSYKSKLLDPVIVCGADRCDRLADCYPLTMQRDTAFVYLLNNSGMTPAKLNQAAEHAALLDSILT